MKKNRILVLLGALAAQMSIGAIYSWSIFNGPFAEVLNVDTGDIYRTYSIAIFFFAFATFFAGRIQLKKGPRFTAIIGGLLYSAGVFLSGFATSPYMLYLTYGVIAGAGVGFVYVVPLATLIKWYPAKKGSITGLAVAAFALGGLVFKEVAMAVMGPAADVTADILRSTFMTLGVIYFILTVGGGFFLVNPDGFEGKAAAGTDEDMQPSQLVKSVAFYQVLLSYFFAVIPGLLVIGLASNIAQKAVGMTVAQAATVVGIFSLLNAAGRLFSGMLADKLGVRNVLKGMYVMSIIALAIMSFMYTKLNVTIFYVAMIGVIMSYGSFLALYPGVVSSTFGQKYYSANYGLVYQAYGIAGLIGPFIKEATHGHYEQTFLVAMIASIIGCIILFTLKKPEIKA